MKVICDCGAKYAFDATPDMVRNPINFACPTCGVDLSPQMNAQVREQFGVPTSPNPVGAAPATEIALPPPGKSTVSPAAPPPPPPRISIHVPTAAPASAPAPAAAVPPPPPPVPLPSASPAVRLSHGASSKSAASTPDVVDTRFCSKHPRVRVTEQCRVCGKPICPQCMQLFGYLCSPHCKEKAELQGIEVPVYVGQRDEKERKQWRKVGLVTTLAAVLVVSILGVWFWYAWFGSRPRAAFKIRFEDEPAMSGSSAICPDNQIVFIHGAKIARYDLKTKQQVWLRQAVDKKKIEAEAAAAIKEMQAEAAADPDPGEFPIKIPSQAELTKDMIQGAEQSLTLRVHGKNIWVADGEKARRFDWDTGDPKEEVELTADFTEGNLRNDTLEFKEQIGPARLSITRFNLASGKVDKEEIGEKPPTLATTTANPLLAALAAGKTGSKTSGNVGSMTPHQLAAAVANAPLAGKLASPATISVTRRQQEALDEMEEMDEDMNGTGRGGNLDSLDEDDLLVRRDSSTVIPTTTGYIQMTSKMLEKNIVARSAAKAAPKKSALDGPVNAAATMDIANELLNEMSRNAGADVVREDNSKYKVTLRLGGKSDAPVWEGDVIGAPEIYPQTTVNVLSAGKKLLVFDQQNKLKWESTLNYALTGDGSYYDLDDAGRTGLGPVVERGEILYVFDQGVLSAFELATGNAIWRLPSVGITGMFFDDTGMIYLNTTTASPDKIKYSRQINVMDNTADVVLKLDPKTGKEIWKHSMGGQIAYLSGKFIYTLSYIAPLDEDEELDENLSTLGLQEKPYVRIRRISPKNGRVLWDYYEPRGALDVKVHQNTFQIVQKKQVEVLKFISF